MPPLQIRGPDLDPPPGNHVVTLYGQPNEDRITTKQGEAPAIDPEAPVLYVVAETAQQLVKMAVLWQVGGADPVKLRAPQNGFPPIIYGIPDAAEVERRRGEAQDQWGGNPPCYLIAESPGQVVWLVWVWQNGPYPP